MAPNRVSPWYQGPESSCRDDAALGYLRAHRARRVGESATDPFRWLRRPPSPRPPRRGFATCSAPAAGPRPRRWLLTRERRLRAPTPSRPSAPRRNPPRRRPVRLCGPSPPGEAAGKPAPPVEVWASTFTPAALRGRSGELRRAECQFRAEDVHGEHELIASIASSANRS